MQYSHIIHCIHNILKVLTPDVQQSNTKTMRKQYESNTKTMRKQYKNNTKAIRKLEIKLSHFDPFSSNNREVNLQNLSVYRCSTNVQTAALDNNKPQKTRENLFFLFQILLHMPRICRCNNKILT